jgi:hypothetical protein
MDGAWSQRLEVELGETGNYRVISDTAGAAEALIYRWPTDRGRAYNHAKRVCLSVLNGDMEGEQARSAFIAAANEADVSIRHWQRNIPQGRSSAKRFGLRRANG